MRRLTGLLTRAAFALGLAAAAASIATAPARAEDPSVSLIQLRAYIIVPVGLDQGKFKEAGVAVDPKIVTDNLLINEAMSANTSEVGITGATYQALAAPDLPYSIIAVAEQSPEAVGVMTAADSEIKSLADLKGKTIAGGDGEPIAYLQEALADVGVHKGDYKYVKIEASTGAAALASKQIDAWVSYNPFIAANVSKGLAKVIFTPSTKYFNNFVIILATKKAIAEKPDALAAFLKGYGKSLEWVQSNKDAAVQAYSKATGLEPDVAAATFAKRNQQFKSPDASVVADFSREAQLYIKYGLIPAEPDWSKVMTTEIWDRAFKK
ncbi:MULTISPECIES: ABC transporter substrate-binding protein [unclassified Mesorhizobium]|mgnify:FL=1|uniref:ABC transporter substrate-binding protein n=1 Tax=unclassified Mesorhizobium TaxID=325217 RepID=UPI000B010506|nr:MULTISPECIES: ABC transporter substrate-binding protein [unclassified Mesorhizobium]MBN9255029.1 ABC transporter substrate-binding protein [Mesorhizobium sp.]